MACKDFISDHTLLVEVEKCFGDLCCPDETDFIGCFENENGDFLHLPDIIESEAMTPCFCLGFCEMLNYSLGFVANGK